jgi:hypothetical protein
MSTPHYRIEKGGCQALALGSYRHNLAYIAALKSSVIKPVQVTVCYWYNLAYTAALKSSVSLLQPILQTVQLFFVFSFFFICSEARFHRQLQNSKRFNSHLKAPFLLTTSQNCGVTC